MDAGLKNGCGPAHVRAAWYVPEVNERRASLRYRCMYPAAELRRRGHVADVVTDDRCLGYDTVVLDAWTLFPSTAGADAAADVLRLAAQARQQGRRVVLDNCDNQFSGAPNAEWVVACERLVELARLADAVTTCSTALAEVMQEKCGLPQRPAVIGDPVEDRIVYGDDSWFKSALSLHRKRAWWALQSHARWLTDMRAQRRTPLVWFGSSGNAFASGGLADLPPVLPILEEVDVADPLCLTIISNSPVRFEQAVRDTRLVVRYLEWDRTTFIDALRLHDISIIPVTCNDFTRCKSANRLTLSLHHGLNVVADGIPSYLDYGSVSVLDDWHRGLTAYLHVPELRAEHLQRGRQLVEQHCALSAIASAWEGVLRRPVLAG